MRTQNVNRLRSIFRFTSVATNFYLIRLAWWNINRGRTKIRMAPNNQPNRKEKYENVIHTKWREKNKTYHGIKDDTLIVTMEIIVWVAHSTGSVLKATMKKKRTKSKLFISLHSMCASWRTPFHLVRSFNHSLFRTPNFVCECLFYQIIWE